MNHTWNLQYHFSNKSIRPNSVTTSTLQENGLITHNIDNVLLIIWKWFKGSRDNRNSVTKQISDNTFDYKFDKVRPFVVSVSNGGTYKFSILFDMSGFAHTFEIY